MAARESKAEKVAIAAELELNALFSFIVPSGVAARYCVTLKANGNCHFIEFVDHALVQRLFDSR